MLLIMRGQGRCFPGLALSVFLLLVMLTMSPSSHAQTYPFREYTSDDESAVSWRRWGQCRTAR